MTKIANYFMTALAVALFAACGTKPTHPQVEGHYTYEHAFNYDYQGNHFDVSETGTMDFYADGTGLDSAQQVYTVTRPEGDTIIYVFDYVSPSRWSVSADTFFFAGIKESFRMRPDKEDMLSQEIVKLVSGSIDYQYKFHLDTLTADKLQWSFTYRDGHSDTWEFFRR
ncbi:MAG: hypothetical protein IK010_08565 [Bacteroidales bacterium]|nr:hypothetical protein [Bacteroidales bacterium]MBR4774464.1 hypothetical protein [Bacteroidales bacterium]